MLPERGEACGFLVGEPPGAWPGAGRDGFALTPLELLGAIRHSRELGAEVVGVYHEHPSGNLSPSWQDHRGAVEGWLYLILDRQRRYRLYRRERERFTLLESA